MTTDLDTNATNRLPEPIARAWRRARAAKSEDRSQRAVDALEDVARTLAALVLPDYLRGPAHPAVEHILERQLEKPGPGIFFALFAGMLAAIDSREEPAPFFDGASAWWHRGGTGVDPGKGLTFELVEARNKQVHDGVIREWSYWRSGLQKLLRGLRWLEGYTFLQMEKGVQLRGGRWRGSIVVWRGAEAETLEERVLDRIHDDRLRLLHEARPEAIDVSPWMRRSPRSGRIDVLDKLVGGKRKWRYAQGAEVEGFDNGTGAETTFARFLEGRGDEVWVEVLNGLDDVRPPPEDVRFEEVRQVGEGAFATVLEVHDRHVGDTCALKMLKDRYWSDAVARKRFISEARLLRKLRHEGILTAEMVTHRGRTAIRCPLIAGGSLERFLKDGGRMGEGDLTEAARQLLAALAYAHGQGVVHRDVKPANILRGPHGLLLCDFGIAREHGAERLTLQDAEPAGTEAYMAPEHRRGEATPKSDVYSLALVLTELARGKGHMAIPGDGVSGRVGEVVRWMGDDRADERPDATRALKRLAAPRTRVKGEPGRVCQPQALALARHAMALDPLPVEVDEALRARNADIGWAWIVQSWRRLHWPALVPQQPIGAILDVAGVPFREDRIVRALAARGLFLDGAASVRDVPAQILGTTGFVGCLAPGRPVSERELLGAVRRQAGLAPADCMDVGHWVEIAASLTDEEYEEVILWTPGDRRRRLLVPGPRRAAIQRLIARALQPSALPEMEAATGFLRHRGTALHAWIHSGARDAVVVDIRDFFGSVRTEQVYLALKAGPFCDFSQIGVHSIAGLVTHAACGGALPQGAPSSPIVANLVAADLDRHILGACREEFGSELWRYSRYADDLAISFGADPAVFGMRHFYDAALEILHASLRSQGWSPAPEKTRRWRAHQGPLVLCGVEVSSRTGGPPELPRSVRRRLRAAIHRLDREPDAQAIGLLSYAWAIAGDLRWIVLASPRVRGRVQAVAEALGIEVEDILVAWSEVRGTLGDAGEPAVDSRYLAL